MKSCACKSPSPKPQKPEVCVKCGSVLGCEWLSSDATITEFFKRLSDAFPGAQWLEDFQIECEARERAGRDSFGLEYLDRDNCREAREEASDGALYAYLEVLRNRREGNDDQMDIALIAAYHFGQAYAAMQIMRLKERGRV